MIGPYHLGLRALQVAGEPARTGTRDGGDVFEIGCKSLAAGTAYSIRVRAVRQQHREERRAFLRLTQCLSSTGEQLGRIGLGVRDVLDSCGALRER